MAEDPVDKAAAWEGAGRLQPVWSELARRMGASQRPVRRFTVRGLDEPERRTLASLLGSGRLPAQPEVTVDADKFTTALGLADAGELRRLVERLCGPLGDRAAENAAAQQERANLWQRADERLRSRVPRTLERLRAAGVPSGDVVAHSRLVDLLAETLDELPCRPLLPLPMLAWRVAGDPHALDAPATAGRWLQLAAAELAGAWPEGADPDALALRRALVRLGIIADRLSTPTLTAGLEARGDTALGRLLRAAGGAPLPVTGAMLDGPVPDFASSRWLVVENPSVVEAAVLEDRHVPVVCSSGWPSTDAQRLLDLARNRGVALVYAGDFDRAGLEIASFVATRFGAEVAMTAEVYRGADLARAPVWPEQQDIPPTPWDPLLAPAIAERRRVVYQEDPAVWRALLDGFRG